ncbi:hypothetical protein [Corallibacter sp.]|uniref:hypothetical protein n=1 Tax=Corallibacter sp. TaxID=2038084 RepID=UPI003AB1925B
MKQLIIIAICITFTTSCSKHVENYIPNISGYWEIEKVTLPDGTVKEYAYNNTIDYLEITDSINGIRKKLKPTLNNTFETSNIIENFEIKIENDSLNLYYKTPFDTWKETILLATESQLKVVNKNKAVFVYKRFEPIKITN